MRQHLCYDKLPDYLIGNEVIMTGDDKLIPMKTTTKKGGILYETSHPLVYDNLTKEWTSYPEYQEDTPFCSTIMWRMQDGEIKILDLETMDTSYVELPSEYNVLDASDLLLYPNFYVYESFGIVQQIYIVSQQRWVTISSDIANQLEELIQFVCPENDHTLVLNQRYRIRFQQE